MKKKIIAFALSLFFATGALALVYWYVQQNLQEVTVVAVSKDLPPYTRLTEGMVELKKVAVNGLHSRAATNLSSVLNKYTTTPFVAGEIILTNKISSANRLPKGYLHQLKPEERVIAISTDLTKSVGGTVKPGDLVDLIVVLEEKVAGRNLAKTFLQQVRVIDVRDPNAKQLDEKTQKDEQQIINTNQKKVPGAVLLAVQSQQAEQIALYQKLGEITLVVNPVNAKPVTTAGVQMKTAALY